MRFDSNSVVEEHEGGKVRIRLLPDECADYDNLAGDMFNPAVNTDIEPEELERQEQEFKDRINRDGVWGVVGEFWNGEEWEEADSCWGFVGDDWKGSGYDKEIRETTIKAYREQKHCPTCGRPARKER